MARILYGVAGEGMGHAIRSRVIIDHLSREHDVQVVVSGRAHDYLKAREHDRLGVNRIWGLSIVYEDNEVQQLRTILSNVTGAFTGGLPKNARAYFDLTTQFQPDVVVSDFETWSYLFFIEFEGHQDDPKVTAVLSELEEQTVMLKILGSYPQAVI